jgi:hypothetical protein
MKLESIQLPLVTLVAETQLSVSFLQEIIVREIIIATNPRI